MVRNIIFDWSGTLVDDLPSVWIASNYVFQQAGLPEISLEQFRAEFCLPFANFYRRYLPDQPIAQLEQWFHARFAEVQDQVVPLPHALEFLAFCQTRGHRLFLLSAVHPRMFARQTAPHGLGACFERTYLGVTDKRQVIGTLISENRLLPEETIFVGDMEHDIEAARHGGVRGVAVLTGYNSLAQLRAAGPDLIVEHLGELKAVLERHEGRLPVTSPISHSITMDRRPIATVGALIGDDQGRHLMVRTHKWSDLWGIPGGKIELGETAEAALRREIREETGLEVTDIRLVMVHDAISPPEFYRDAHFLLLNYTCRALDPLVVRLNEEAQEFRWVTADELAALPLNTPTRILWKQLHSESPSDHLAVARGTGTEPESRP